MPRCAGIWSGIEGHGREQGAVLAFGLPDIDDRLPRGGLARGHLHEAIEGGAASQYAGIATLFCCRAFSRGCRTGAVVPARPRFVCARPRAGWFASDRVIFCETWKNRDVLPAMEEGLKCKGLAGVVGEVSRLSLNASRRLQLCAGESGVTALIIRRWHNMAEKNAAGEPNAAATRWRVSPSPSPASGFDGLPRQHWQLDLLRVRGGEPHSWIGRHAMRRVISLYLPHWPTDRLRRASKDAPHGIKPLVTAIMQGDNAA